MAEEQTAAAPVQAATPEKALPDKKVTQLIYCGPTLPHKYGLHQYQCFIGGTPDRLTDPIKDCPELKSLFIAPEGLAKARIAIDQKGTALYSQYQAVLTYFRKG